ncbi:GNAT family N-acetyltransferase [Rathayibacter oskolensis]|uniref:GNAT family N-acetyltransferase n=1 Tax=Rathayibacter oskolensis TaxID=1891671 RepID=UPI00265D6D1C|nr:GNAT family N-acetyltransferase [Rathayibacter oskolensis]WKK71095.1 GNAT family N-acetyltransferase [Rathayibacter oskolensis]
MSSTDTVPSADGFVHVRADDPRARPLLDELELEYDTRYGTSWGGPASTELSRYPAEDFAPPKGGFVLLLRDGTAIAGGAFKAFDDRTCELKRIWTSSSHRRQGLALRVVAELEAEARRLGYSTAYLTTGPLQPEAQRLYLTAGYTPLFDATQPPEVVVLHGYAKTLTDSPLDVGRIQEAHDAEFRALLAVLPDGGERLRAATRERRG